MGAHQFVSLSRRDGVDHIMIKYVQIFGERRSGTNFLASLIQKNFQGVELTTSFGFKHWFIKDHFPRGPANECTDYECERPLQDSADTLFLVIYRHPLGWLRSLHTCPYHAPDHWNLPFSEFIRKKWVSYETIRLNPIWPQNDRDIYVIEEAENILKLRTQKIKHFNCLQGVVPHVRFLNYEQLLARNEILRTVAEDFGIGLKEGLILGDDCYLEGGGRTDRLYARKTFSTIDPRDLEFIRENVDWELEGRIGYSVRPSELSRGP